ncbi:zeta toxin family protein [Aquabacterium parvum]|uniref:zeta toxin family protein n=1 Tax=Aquabacterium parvum TaxID=70584 RepID=UPI0009F8E91A|nr:zeta toxin family protein [Aquabacterium parvum]MBU0915773.1 zeta toxin family protein [Gammaproteobacteria bacterium]
MDQTAHAPRIFVLAGTNGAGKSSIGGATIRAHGAQYFNPDEAAARIRAAQPHLSATQANSAAWHEGKRLLQHAIAQRLDHNFETTLGGQSFARLLKQAALAGIEVRIWYVGLASPEQHLARVKARVRKGGHDIPEADIRRRFDQSRLQLIQLMPHLAELRVYDNSHDADPHQGQAPQPKLVVHWQQGRVRVPASATDMGQTPEWAKPIAMAAIKAAASRQTASSTEPKAAKAKSSEPKLSALKPASPTGARPKRSRPAK